MTRTANRFTVCPVKRDRTQPDEGAFDIGPQEDVWEGCRPDRAHERLVGFYLRPYEIRDLDDLARARGWTRAHLIRAALSQYLGEHGKPLLAPRRQVAMGGGRKPLVPARLPGEMLVDYHTRTLGRFPGPDDPSAPDATVVETEQRVLETLDRVRVNETKRLKET